MFGLLAGWDAGILYAISQLFALLGTVFSLVAVQQKRKVQILNINVLASGCAVMHYLFLGAETGVMMKLVGIIRNSVAAYEASKHRASRVLPLVFVGFYILSGILTFDSVFSLLPMVGTCFFTVAMYLGDEKAIRYSAGFASALWLVYNMHILSIVGMLSETIYISNDLVAIWRFRKGKQKKKRK